MRSEWDLDDLVASWTLCDADRDLLSELHPPSRLSFALMVKFFEIEGRFPRHRGEVPAVAVAFVARQLGVPIDAPFEVPGQAAADADAYLPDRAMLLTKLSIRLSELGHHEQALALVEEATGIFSRLAAANPHAGDPPPTDDNDRLIPTEGGHPPPAAGDPDARRISQAADSIRLYAATNPWMQVDDQTRRGDYALARATLKRLRRTTTNRSDLARIDERFRHIDECQARRDADVARYRLDHPPVPLPDDRPGVVLAVAVYAFIVATAVVVVRGILQESQWWAACAVIILTPLALLLTGFEAWGELTSALPRPLWLPLAALSAGYLTYVVFRFGLPTVLLCVGAFMLSTLLFLFPVSEVLSAWYNRGRPYDHL